MKLEGRRRFSPAEVVFGLKKSAQPCSRQLFRRVQSNLNRLPFANGHAQVRALVQASGQPLQQIKDQLADLNPVTDNIGKVTIWGQFQVETLLG